MVTWGRLNAGEASGAEEEPDEDLPKTRTRRPGPVRNRPLAFVLREDLRAFLVPATEDSLLAGLPSAATEVAEFLATRGASFLPEIARGTGRLPAEVERVGIPADAPRNHREHAVGPDRREPEASGAVIESGMA